VAHASGDQAKGDGRSVIDSCKFEHEVKECVHIMINRVRMGCKSLEHPTDEMDQILQKASAMFPSERPVTPMLFMWPEAPYHPDRSCFREF
jgi:hypothetical protein